jgi:DNA-binding IclR family transcriptional regulator
MEKSELENETDNIKGARTEAGSLQRGLALLEILQGAQRPLVATELAEATRQPLSTVHRLMQALIQNGYVYRDASKRYFAGPKALMPLNLYHPLNILRREAHQHLRALRDQFRQTTSLIVFLGVERLAVELALENESLSPYYATHLKSFLHGAASGKILLAGLSPQARAKLLGHGPLPRATPSTITDPGALEAELEVVRKRGYAVAIDENYVGHSAAAAAIHASPTHVIGCFGLAGLTKNIGREGIHAAGEALKMTADLFSVGSSAVRAIAVFMGQGRSDSAVPPSLD